MIAIDTNIIVYAHRIENPWHKKADNFLTKIAESNEHWAIPYPCLSEFLAIVTNARIFKKPTPLNHALKELENISLSPHLSFIGALPDFLEVFSEVCQKSKVVGGMVHDAKIATICIQHGIKILFTADKDYSRFKTIKVKNPLL